MSSGIGGGGGGKSGKNLFQALGISGKPLIGSGPEGVDPNSFDGIMGNPAMRFGMGMLKRAGEGGSFGQHLAGSIDDVASGYDKDEERAMRRMQMEQYRASAAKMKSILGGDDPEASGSGGEVAYGPPPSGAKAPSRFVTDDVYDPTFAIRARRRGGLGPR